MGILNCWWPAHRSFFSHRSFSEDGSGGGRHPDARSLSHAIGAACLPVGRGYTLQVRATRQPTLGGLSVPIPCRSSATHERCEHQD